MIGNNELTLAPEDYDKAFTEVSFLLDMLIETITAFVGKSTPALGVASGRKMALNMPVLMVQHNVFLALAVVLTIMVGISYIFLWDEPRGDVAPFIFGGLAAFFWVSFYMVNKQIQD